MFRIDFNRFGGAVGYFREITRSIAKQGMIRNPSLGPVASEKLGGHVWTHATITGRVLLQQMAIEAWVYSDPGGDYVVQLSHPAGVGPDDPLVRSVREALATFQPAARDPPKPNLFPDVPAPSLPTVPMPRLTSDPGDRTVTESHNR
jgi:hypothetical protein